MQKKDLIDLAARIHDGTASEADIIRYNAWYNGLQRLDAAEPPYPDEAALLGKIHSAIDRKTKVRPLGFWLRAAAVAAILAGTGTWLFISKKPSKQPVVQHAIVQDAAPAGNKAYLTLADGSKIALEDAKAGQLALQGGMRITKTAGGEIIYESDTAAATAPGTAVSYNMLSVPRGGQFRLLLPDGSKVWLNAESSLRFPTAFTGKERLVELSGEGYFEVAKNARQPFIVSSAAQKVTVLGTHFNVQAYPGEAGVRTTLLEGKVEVATAVAKQLLAPGEQCRLNVQSGRMRTVNVDTEEAVAWKNGYFIFNETSMKEVLRQLCRWYNVEADFSRVPDISYNGSIPRNVKLSQAIRMLSETGGVPLKLEGQTISVR
ncbi:FecR family protein [Chitinophaga sp. GCM10012297]|uniref:FecR domain-containing protein n=1 Tax=Chitinophaga chungangae TaxID=2821488 RepID=A0ABS3YJH8_9BACT|nr:FecR family protein [Chitinophaga chungangae]MBO9154804.1 FecR domain-containing protein [Chitinophaga chungangae]